MKHSAAAVGAFLFLLGVSAVLCATDLSGIPDDGPVPVPMLPAFLFHQQSDAVRSCWLLACLAWLVPPLFTALRGWRDGLLTCVVLLLGAFLVLPKPDVVHEDYVPSYTVGSMVEGLLWLAALTASGAGLGTFIRRAGRSKSGSHQGRPA
jgi:hypothetical protein